jgi:UPF0042 nucleotide-binding protein
MRIVVVTGMSGSGKTHALHALEDIGYYAIDNLPIRLLDKLVELFGGTTGEVEKLALVVDARMSQGASAHAASDLTLVPNILQGTRLKGHEVDLVFLDAADQVLARRYSETRRRHPLSADGSVASGIALERALLEPLQVAATARFDTSRMSVHDLKHRIQHAFSGGAATPLSVTVMSFGFKHGVPAEADLVLDVRFLPNPYFVEDLRLRTGLEPPVAEYVLDRPDTRTFLERTTSLLDFLLPRYDDEGKAYLTIAIGCTGGRHRSVAIAGAIARWIEARGTRVQSRHRDLER